uniref:Uncharacterized protein n=1 Tax=Rhizophora mucronata TaxID=61149 RepID=A0A2P2QPZ0_RHIMU
MKRIVPSFGKAYSISLDYGCPFKSCISNKDARDVG